MIKRIPHYFLHDDDRGSIQGLINTGTWEEMNYITASSGTVRGGHYHKYTSEAFFILEGEIIVTTRNLKLKTSKDEDTVKAGDFFIIDPFTVHTFFIVKDAKWINLLSRKMGDTDKDFFREL